MIGALQLTAPIGAAVAAWTLAGLGIGLAYSPISLLALRHAPSGALRRWTSASLNLSDVLGTALGAGVAGAIVVAGAHRGWSASGAVSVAFALAAVVAMGAIALTRLAAVRSRFDRPAADAVVGVA